MNNASCEIIPSQLIALLRPDSSGSAFSGNLGGRIEFSFSGFDDYAYRVESSTDFVNWTTLGTYLPTNGVFRFSAENGPSLRFYRTVLAP